MVVFETLLHEAFKAVRVVLMAEPSIEQNVFHDIYFSKASLQMFMLSHSKSKTEKLCIWGKHTINYQAYT